MDKYKEQLNRIAFSDAIYKKIIEIGNRYDLNLDQTGELAAAIRDVVTEIEPSSKFTDNIETKMEVDKIKAQKVSADVNQEIFRLIRSMLQQLTETNEVVESKGKTAPISPIEKVGNFTIEHPPASSSPQYNDHTLSREDVLADLEGIKNLKPENAENYVEHLISSPAPQIQPVPDVPLTPARPEPPQVTPQPKTEPRKYEADPYRESI